MNLDDRAPVFVISVAAELAGMHPQTLRTYDRLGIVSPSRTSGRGRRYSAFDISQLRQVQQLSQEEGINLAGIKRIMELEKRLADMQDELAEVTRQQTTTWETSADGRNVTRTRSQRIFATSRDGEVTQLAPGQRPRRRQNSGALVVWRPLR